jgi:hypothetical protein
MRPVAARPGRPSSISPCRIDRTSVPPPPSGTESDVTISTDVIRDCFSEDDTVSFPAFTPLYDFLLQSKRDDFDDFCHKVFPYETFISHCFAHLEDMTGDFAFLCLDLAFFCDTVDLGELFAGDFPNLLFAKLQSPDVDQADASLHILAVLCCHEPLFVPSCSHLASLI